MSSPRPQPAGDVSVTFDDLVKMPDFTSLSPEARVSALRRTGDAQFNALSPEAQLQVATTIPTAPGYTTVDRLAVDLGAGMGELGLGAAAGIVSRDPRVTQAAGDVGAAIGGGGVRALQEMVRNPEAARALVEGALRPQVGETVNEPGRQRTRVGPATIGYDIRGLYGLPTPPDEPAPPPTRAANKVLGPALQEAATQGVAGPITRRVFRLGRGILQQRPIARLNPLAVDEEVREAVTFLQALGGGRAVQGARGVQPDFKPIATVGELTQNKPLIFLENAARSSFVGGKPLREIDRNLDATIQQSINDLVRSFGIVLEREAPGAEATTRKAVGEAVIATINDKDAAARRAASGVYNRVFEEADARGVMVPLQNVQEYALDAVEAAQEVNQIGGAAAGDVIAKRLQDINRDGGLRAESAHELRSRLRALIRKASSSNPNSPAVRRLKQLEARVDGALLSSLRRADPLLEKLLNDTDAVVRKRTEALSNETLRRLVKLDLDQSGRGPETFLPSVFRPGQVTPIERVFEALDYVDPLGGAAARQTNRALKEQVRGKFLEDLMHRSMRQRKLAGEETAVAVFDPTIFLNLLDDEAQFREAARVAFSADDLARFKRFAKAVKKVDEARMTEAGAGNLRLAQGAAVIALPTGRLTRTAAAVLVTPGLAAKLLGSSRGTALLTGGYQATLGTRAAGAVGRSAINRLQVETLRYAVEQRQRDAEAHAPYLPGQEPEPLATKGLLEIAAESPPGQLVGAGLGAAARAYQAFAEPPPLRERGSQVNPALPRR